MSQRGGKREGAGRPSGCGKYGAEPTKTIRIPISRLADIHELLDQESKTPVLPLYLSKVQAGFPSPGDDYIDRYLDLNQQLVQHPAATFIVTATGDSMTDVGIHSGDMLIVDKSLEAQHGKIVIAALNGELTVKRLSKIRGRVQLLPENPRYKPIDITDEQDLVIWGVVIHVIHSFL
ncbi:LexA family protein [Legionella drancourtii]|uniref:SOS (Error prone) mutagenesis protein UmuD (RumA) n=1 Tax=Legionella drancourtii LLAP12 TaxID=658187 RepID=G9EQ07_9GAMM|nr:translesion error-prone DNA polymerase V autoproteolytic subunit [Legionella drancourtii]EHL30582.1 SOS (error prone) mutagenesis protein UmuD (RumA) [Legionella drancourtii LLAP12]